MKRFRDTTWDDEHPKEVKEMRAPTKGSTVAKPKEIVNHSDHYNIPGRKECIEEMLEKYGLDKVKAFCELNAYKYEYRQEQKNGAEDLKKAKWYQDKLESLEVNQKFCEMKVEIVRLAGENEKMKRKVDFYMKRTENLSREIQRLKAAINGHITYTPKTAMEATIAGEYIMFNAPTFGAGKSEVASMIPAAEPIRGSIKKEDGAAQKFEEFLKLIRKYQPMPFKFPPTDGDYMLLNAEPIEAASMERLGKTIYQKIDKAIRKSSIDIKEFTSAPDVNKFTSAEEFTTHIMGKFTEVK